MRTKFLLSCIGLLACLATTTAQFDIIVDCGTIEEEPSEGSSVSQNCNDNFSSFRGHHADDMVPQGIDRTLKLKTNVIFVQDDNGEGNYSISNPEHMEYWHRVFDTMNYILKNLVEQSCNCLTNPTHYSNIHIEFDPKFVEIQNSYYWNHRHDADSNTYNSTDKPYLNAIHNLATQVPGYIDGFDWIITMDSIFWNRWIANNGTVPIWTLGYDCKYGPVYTFPADSACVNYSGDPVYVLDRPAMWHSPDKYLVYVNALNHVYPYGQAYIEKNIPETAGGALHEYGHYFGLFHPPTNQCSLNIMKQAGGAARKSFSACQVRTMYETLMTKNLRKYVICEDKLDYFITIDSDETWSINTRIFGDIVIRDSSTLRITCEVSMDPESRIIVGRGSTLIIDGGFLTSDCEEKWNCIIVEGDIPGKQANSGKVILKNMATIELAKTAVSMFPSHIQWNNGTQQNYYGGIIKAENSTFRNCNRGVEFMKYDSLGVKDSSFFNEVLFEDLNYGVTIWGNDGVTFDSCNFKNIQKAGIYAYDSEVIVRSNNIFEETPVGVDILSTYLRRFSSKIGQTGNIENQFLSNIGINIQSSGNIEPIQIVNNIFTGIESGDKGIHSNGNGLISIQKNSFSDERKAIEIFEAGNHFNLVMNNEIEDSWVGSHSIKSNLGLRYLDNCFSSSSLMDIAVTVGGIFPFQGNSQTGAGNCFTKNEITEIYNGASDPIYYFIETGTSQTSCTYPQNLYSVTLSATALDQNDLNCGPGPVPIIRPVDLCAIDEGQTISQLIDDRSDLLNGFKMATVNSYEKNQYQQCIEVIESLIVSKMLDRNFVSTASGIDSAIDFLFGAGMNFKDSIIAYGILVNIGDLSRARNVLNSLNPKTAEESDFIYVQDINLDYLENPVAYAITSEVIGDLYSIGLSDGPYSGYSRSLYEIFTGERLEVDIPVEWRAPLFEPKIKAAPNIRVYPNPSAAGNLNVEVSSLSEDKFKIRLSSPLGFDLFEYNIESDGVYSINPPDMIPGVYFLSLIDSKNQAIIVSRVLLY